MGRVIIQENYTTKHPITMIGEEAGICWGADTSNPQKNYERGISCLKSQHGRTWEFPDIYMVLEGYSARVIREWYTHLGGSPTRLQASTRYINYEHGFDFVIPYSIKNKKSSFYLYMSAMQNIIDTLRSLDDLGIPKEDSAMLLPLGMCTKIVDKRNFRNLVDMSHQRMCSRAYWEFRELFDDISKALSEYSEEWKYLVEHYFMPKCELYGYCTEAKSCGRKEKREKNE